MFKALPGGRTGVRVGLAVPLGRCPEADGGVPCPVTRTWFQEGTAWPVVTLGVSVIFFFFFFLA